MARRVSGTTFTASRPVNIGGTNYAVGATIPGTALARVRNLSALISRGFVLPDRDVYGRTRISKRARRERTFTPAERRALT